MPTALRNLLPALAGANSGIGGAAVSPAASFTMPGGAPYATGALSNIGSAAPAIAAAAPGMPGASSSVGPGIDLGGGRTMGTGAPLGGMASGGLMQLIQRQIQQRNAGFGGTSPLG